MAATAAVTGRYRRIKTGLALLLLGWFFLVPWLRWDRGPDLPGQAILFDLPGRRLFMFALEFWPQELLDRDSQVVTYQAWRGEARGRKRIPLRPDLGGHPMGRAATASTAPAASPSARP